LSCGGDGFDTDLSAKEEAAEQGSGVPQADEDGERAQGARAQAGEGQGETHALKI